MRDVGVRPRPVTTEVSPGATPSTGSTDVDAFRRRLLKGLQSSIEERGYRDTTITDIVGHARASRRTFYKAFATKDDCFVALMAAANQNLLRRIEAAVDPQAPWQRQVAQATEAYLAHVATAPAVSLAWIREFPSLGSVAEQVRSTSMSGLVELVRRLSAGPVFARAGIAPLSRERALIVLGGLRELTATVVEEGGDVRRLRDVAVSAAEAVVGSGRSPAPELRR